MKHAKSLFSPLRRIEALPIIFVWIVLLIIQLLTAPEVFTKWGIWSSFLETVPPTLIVALGLTLVITAGEIDLSFPAVVALSGLAFSWSYRTFEPALGAWIGLVLALAAGALVGYINGWLVARLGVPSIMATLASQFFWYGVTIQLANGLSVALKGIREQPIFGLFVGKLFDQVPVQAIWSLLLAILLWFILNRHSFGEAVSFIGDNANVARVMGINVEVTRIRLFMLQGMIAAFAGIVVTLDIGVFYPNQGNFLLPAMASVFVGGTSIAGGAGVVFGTFFGAFVIGSLEASVVATNTSGYWVQTVEGLVMTGIIVLNALVGDGNMAVLSNRLRHWGVPVRARDEATAAKGETPP
jgi:simple sugar transport system permease protein